MNKYQPLINTYRDFWKYTYGFEPKGTAQFFGRQGKAYKELTQHYSENQIKLLIATHFNWLGVDDSDPKQLEWNKKCAFPPEWIVKKCNEYEVNLRNTVDFDNPDEVDKYLEKWLRNIK